MSSHNQGLSMNSSGASTSQGAMQGPSLSPCIGPPWTNWMNGLFDTCGTESTLWSDDSKVTSECSLLDVATIDQSDLDLLSSLPPGGQITDPVELSSPTDSEGDFFDHSFMEIFTDLNDIMKMAEPEVTVEPVIELEPTLQENTVSTSNSKQGRKRKAAAATTSETNPSGKDHRYSTKKSRPNTIQLASSVMDVDLTTPDEEEDRSTPPAEVKKQKYAERRRKNNIASQKSRKNRKTKNSSLEQQAEDLEAENAAMRVKIAEAEALTKELKEILVTQLAGVKT